jgi:PAS domain S-box-containing protein
LIVNTKSIIFTDLRINFMYNNTESEKIYKSIFESSMEAILLTKPDGTILAANHKAQEMLGYSEEQLCIIGRSGIIDNEDPNLSLLLEDRRVKGNSICELTFIRSNGERFPALVSSHIFKDEEGIEKTSTVIRDLKDFKNKELALTKSEQRYIKLFENMMEGYSYCKMLFDDDGNPDDWIYLEVNQAFEQLTGLKNVKGKRVTEVIPDVKELEPDLFEIYGRVALTGVHEKFELFFKPLNIWLNISVYMPEKEHFVAIFDNITQRKIAEEELVSSQKKYENLFQNAHTGIFRAKIDEPDILEVNKQILKMSGYSEEELLSGDFSHSWADHGELNKIMAEVMTNGSVINREVSLYTKDGDIRTAQVSFKLYPEEGYFEGTVQDITESKVLEEQLKKSLDEKDLLIKEIHHRVKNNLMVISSLLSLQSRYIKDKEARGFFRESQNRARSMALIHELLYRSENLKSIEFGDYILSLSKELFHLYSVDGLIELKIDVDDIYLDINTSIPLGLIVNEVVTNSLKHAFPDGRAGVIHVDFHKTDDHYEFKVKDNGIGFPEDLDFKDTDSLGLQMVTSLTRQIEGNIELDRNHGTEFKITFKESEY